MLRRVHLKNFIHFKDEQILKFQHGPHFFIGQNNSGKSSVLEGIRRCMSTEKNMSFSNPHDHTQPAVVVCIYDVDDKDIKSEGRKKAPSDLTRVTEEESKTSKVVQTDLAFNHGERERTESKAESENEDVFIKVPVEHVEGKMNLTNINKLDHVAAERDDNKEDTESEIKEQEIGDGTSKTKISFISSIVRLPSYTVSLKGSVFIKTALIDSMKDTSRVGMDVVTETTESTLKNSEIHLSSDDVKEILQFLKKPEDQFDVEEFTSVVLNIYEKSKKKLGDGLSTCEQLLRRFIDSNTVITFPLRSIAPLQWTNSKRLSGELKKQNYDEAQSKAEIVSWYADIENDRNEITKQECEREKLYFNLITDNSGFEFRKEDGNLVAFNECVGCKSDDRISVPLLKVPEGIYEAKRCSVLLALDRFRTVGLEDPERGMHPQMVERLRDLILMDISHKVVFITSHHPSFLAAWNIPRTFFFHRHCDVNELTFTVMPGSQIDCQESEKDRKTPRIITSDHISTLFFAKRVLFLEGEGDYAFMYALRLILMKMTDDNTSIQKIIFNGNTDKSGAVRMAELRKFLCPLKLIKLNGETHKLRFDKLCKDLKIERIFVLDNDAVIKDGTAEQLIQDFSLNMKQEDVVDDVRILEREKIFVWKCGKIEDAVVALKPFCPDLKQFLMEHNVHLQFEAGKSKRKKKLFIDKQLKCSDITEVTEKILDICKDHHECEFARFIRFLYTLSQAA